MKQIEVNDIRRKALHWWRALDSDMKKTMVHNPFVNRLIKNLRNVNHIFNKRR